MSALLRVRNLRVGEQEALPAELRDTGMAYLIPEWVWVVETLEGVPFALIVASQAHSWLVLWRVLALSTLSVDIPLTWFMEAIPQVFSEARARGCVGFLTLLADNRPEEVKIGRIISRLAGTTLLSFQGSMGVGLIAQVEEEDTK